MRHPMASKIINFDINAMASILSQRIIKLVGQIDIRGEKACSKGL
jgi:hypothetical protein